MSQRGPRTQLAAKLGPPRLQAPSIRADQLAAVAAAAHVRLLLVRAPAGYGKTTLVAAAAAELGWQCVWYRLDALDADPQAFLAALGGPLSERLLGFDARSWEAPPGATNRPTAVGRCGALRRRDRPPRRRASCTWSSTTTRLSPARPPSTRSSPRCCPTCRPPCTWSSSAACGPRSLPPSSPWTAGSPRSRTVTCASTALRWPR